MACEQAIVTYFPYFRRVRPRRQERVADSGKERNTTEEVDALDTLRLKTSGVVSRAA